MFSKNFSWSISAQKLKVLRKWIKSELIHSCRSYLMVNKRLFWLLLQIYIRLKIYYKSHILYMWLIIYFQSDIYCQNDEINVLVHVCILNINCKLICLWRIICISQVYRRIVYNLGRILPNCLFFLCTKKKYTVHEFISRIYWQLRFSRDFTP